LHMNPEWVSYSPGMLLNIRQFFLLLFACTFLFHHSIASEAWFDETRVPIAKAAGYSKWFNSCGPDMTRQKMGNLDKINVCPIKIDREESLFREVTKIANLSVALG